MATITTKYKACLLIRRLTVNLVMISDYFNSFFTNAASKFRNLFSVASETDARFYYKRLQK
jgi:hypothetical protein